MNNFNETLIPKVGVITDIRIDTADIKTFRVVTPDGKKAFDHMPGQCAMLSIPGVGEAMFSITSSPTNTEYMEFSIQKCGCVTDWLHQAEVGQQITIRGPYGNAFPVESDEFRGKKLLFIAGGIGIAPLRSVINYCRYHRDNYKSINLVYGSRSMDDLVTYNEILNSWTKYKEMYIYLTVDKEYHDWVKHVAFVPNYVKELQYTPDRVAIVCGPPIMIKFTVAALKELGFKDTQIYTTMELRMKCGVGKCGRCNIGSKYVCKDGPVFRYDELGELPDEY